MLETDNLTITMTAEQAMSVKRILYAVCRTFQRYPRMEIGRSEVHNIYPSDLDTCFAIADELDEKLEA